MSNWPDGTVQTQSGCTIPAGAPLCGDCGNGFRFPPGQARTQQAGLTDFCGAAAPQHRRGAPVSRVWGRHSPTSSRPGGQMSGAKFGPQVDTCSPRLTFSPYLPIQLQFSKSVNRSRYTHKARWRRGYIFAAIVTCQSVGLPLLAAPDTIELKLKTKFFEKSCKVFGYFLSYRLKEPSKHGKGGDCIGGQSNCRTILEEECGRHI